MVKMSCEQHDALAAGSQFVTHLTGRMLAKLSPQPSAIDTNGFKALLKLVENTCQDSFDLFYALYAHNPNSSEQLAQVAEAFEQVRNDLLTFQSGNGSSSSSSHGAPRPSNCRSSSEGSRSPRPSPSRTKRPPSSSRVRRSSPSR